MRRNYGSLNLAALDLSANARATVDISGSSSLLAHELAHLDMHDDCASSAVGYPIESFFANDDAYALADAPRCRKRSLSKFGLSAETRASSSTSIASTCSTSSSTSSQNTSVSTGITIPVPTSAPVMSSSQANSYYPIKKQHNLAIALPQHHVELNALRCLSLNLMLPSSSSSGNPIVTVPQPSTSVPKMNAFEFEISCQPQSDRVTAALLTAGRRGSLPRNMIQSV